MGFDPRRWRPAPGSPAATSNVDALLAENDALRREVRVLRRRLEQLQLQQRQHPNVEGPRFAYGLSPDQVERWGQAMAGHPRWQALRIGPPAGLRGVIEELRSRWWNPELSLEQELDRRSPGLGAELAEALRGAHSRATTSATAAPAPRITPRAQITPTPNARRRRRTPAAMPCGCWGWSPVPASR